MKNVILCGGSGTRLWPLSRKLLPKQFLKLFNDKSLFQQTIERNRMLCDDFLIITNIGHYFLALDQIEEITTHYTLPTINFLLEDIGRNTAPAIAFAAFASDEDELLFVTPSDHLIKNQEKYKKAIDTAKKATEEGYLITFGIEPTEPNTGYGYIEHVVSSNECVVNSDDIKVYDVKKFHEKPDVKTAKTYLQQNATHYSLPTTHYYWNSGMFMFKAGVYLEELKKHSPEVYEACKEVYNRSTTHHLLPTTHYLRITNMQDIPNISIDFAVLEKSNRVKVVKGEFEWNDVGSFDSLTGEMDSKEAIEVDSKNNFYYSDNNKKLIAAIGLENFTIIDTKDALLIAKKGKSQKVKNIVNTLKTTHHSLLATHSTVHRPWGTYETLIEGNGYKIKRIIVKPGKRLSLQKHFHRNEHWIVVSGTAEVQVGDKKYLVRQNESTYIKMGEVHRLSNPGKIPVILIEAQVGEYIDEDDIVRLEDDYQRGSE